MNKAFPTLEILSECITEKFMGFFGFKYFSNFGVKKNMEKKFTR